MCTCIESPHVVAGWRCCRCTQYNGLQRNACRACNVPRCQPLAPDAATGAQFETYEQAYARDPATLAAIHRELARRTGG